MSFLMWQGPPDEINADLHKIYLKPQKIYSNLLIDGAKPQKN